MYVQKGEPWIFWVLIPVVGVILLAGLPIVIFVHLMLKACGFKEGVG